MNTQPQTDQTVSEADKIELAYQGFMRAKYPAKQPEPAVFMWFDPNDKVRDWTRGLTFVRMSREYMLKQPEQRSMADVIRNSISARKRPQKAGWYLDIGSSWCFVGESVEAAIELFDGMRAELLGRSDAS